jgi:hypothetical protein
MCHSTNDKISTFLGCMENVKATFIWLILFLIKILRNINLPIEVCSRGIMLLQFDNV